MVRDIAITGASGFIGKVLCDTLAAEGMRVTRLLRQPGAAADEVAYDLDMECFPEVSAGTIIHCAWAYGRETEDINTRACQVILEHATRNDLRVIFVGSFSAAPDARSAYGRAKWRAACMFMDAGHLVIHPGLVIGEGGLLRRMTETMGRMPFIPLPGGGRQTLQLLPVEDLTHAITVGIREGITGSYHLAAPETISLRDLLRNIPALKGQGRRFISLPLPVYRSALSIASALGLTGNITMENLEGLLANRHRQTEEDLAVFRLPARDPLKLIGRYGHEPA